MIIRNALGSGAKSLKKIAGGWSIAAGEAEILLGLTLGKKLEEIYMRLDENLSASDYRRFRSYLSRRLKHEPIAYICGYKYFFDSKFIVKKRVTLIPRPETEVLIERANALIHANTTIIDVGTGSGAIAISLARSHPHLSIVATDISAAALNIAQKNAQKNGVKKNISFQKTSLLPKRFPKKIERLLIVANLPYIRTTDWKRLPLHIKKFEPRSALDGGKNGLDIYRALFTKLWEHRQQQAFTLLAEIDPEQAIRFAKEIKKYWPKATIKTEKDLSGNIRVMEVIQQ